MAIDSPPTSSGRAAYPYESTLRPGSGLLLRLLGMSRFLIGIAVIGTFIAATALLVYGAVDTYGLIYWLVTGGDAGSRAKELILSCIEITDIFMLATVLYVIAVGLYELFIDDRIPLPAWLVITDIDDLKHKLISVVIAVLGVVFLGQVMSWDGERNLQSLGIAIGAVIGALTYFLNSRGEQRKGVSNAE
jgi:uncharacterized membrane protein YqhA